MATRILHSPICLENEAKWITRVFGKDEYQRKEQVRGLDGNKSLKVVYDNTERSPHYDNSNPYFDDKRLIQGKDTNSSHTKDRFKNRGYRRPLINSGLPRTDKVYTELNPFYRPTDYNDTTLVFESRFESGNLKKAIQVNDFEYDLVVHSDYNSQGYSQWYYFMASNTRTDVKYTFNLYNFYKPDSLYNQGMRPLIYSNKKFVSEGVGWCRVGEDICYYQNSTKKKTGSGYMYTLSFSFELPYENDEVYFCHHYPYTYRDCKNHLDTICNDNKEGKLRQYLIIFWVFRGTS